MAEKSKPPAMRVVGDSSDVTQTDRFQLQNKKANTVLYLLSGCFRIACVQPKIRSKAMD